MWPGRQECGIFALRDLPRRWRPTHPALPASPPLRARRAWRLARRAASPHSDCGAVRGTTPARACLAARLAACLPAHAAELLRFRPQAMTRLRVRWRRLTAPRRLPPPPSLE
eukprot:scaffold7225_cov379-Prasinococcus_capsulatus_cf.AAC.13